MTTIAYKDGVIATDGQMTAGDVIVYLDAYKSQEKDGAHFFLCGSDNDIDEIVNAWPDGKMKRSNRSAGFVVNQCVIFGAVQNYGRCETWEHPKAAAYAYGSGYEFAIGAMDAGCSAEEAIAIAAKRDTATGGTIRTYCAKTGEEL